MKMDLIDRATLPDVRVEIPKRLDNETCRIISGLVKAFQTVIKSAPTVDAVEVVRCDECIFAKNLRSAYVDCKCWRASVPRDGFCYNGERKMDAEVHDDA